MTLVNLPEEILITIIKLLDFKSVYSLYQTCNYLKQLIVTWRVVQECRLSLNTMATARTLKLNFFKDISLHLKELNMCCVPDLCKSVFLPAARKLKNLRTLDVSYTNITMDDCLQILKVCPTIKDIAINFVFGKVRHCSEINEKTLADFQNTFQELINVHFVGSVAGLLDSKLSLCILKNADLDILQYTIIERYMTGELQCHINCATMVKFSRFTVFVLINDLQYDITVSPTLSMIDETKYEFMATKNLDYSLEASISFYATPLFEKFIRDNFTTDVLCVTRVKELLTIIVRSATTISFWDKNSVIFDNVFYKKLLKELNYMYVYNYNSKVGLTVPSMYECYSIVPSVQTSCVEQKSFNNDLFKRKRLAPPNLMMNYDILFKDKKDLQLIISFSNFMRSSVTLSSNCEYLKKITFLSLDGETSYSVEFFNILFRCCDNLITFDLTLSSIGAHPVMASLFRSLPLNKTLKNFRLVSNDLDFKAIYNSLSQCKMLENIHLVDKFVTKSNLPLSTCKTYDPTLILSNCDNLYSIYILAPMSDHVHTSTLQLCNKVKSLFNRHSLNIEINVIGKSLFRQYFRSICKYNPFLDVFRIFRIKSSIYV